MLTTEGVFSWKRRTVASSSVCNFLGEVTTKAKAESTSTRKRDKDKASEVQRRSRESKGFLRNGSPWRKSKVSISLCLLELWGRREKIKGELKLEVELELGLELWRWWKRDLEIEDKACFLFGDRESEVEQVGEGWKIVERSEYAAISPFFGD